jgi:adenylyltransferase/sulfurtransferase
MNDAQLLRYSRQIMLPEIDVTGQKTLLESTALIIGLGGLGSPIAMYLAAAGVGHLILVDFDDVEISNLQRQIIHTTDQLGQAKVDSAKTALHKLNPEIRLSCVNQKLNEDELQEYVQQSNVVLDGSDNFNTRFMVNQVCVQNQTPLVSGAAIRLEGQVSVYLNNGEGPCYRCLYKDGEDQDQTCSENGVLAPVVGIIGSIQATEAIKVLTHLGEPLDGRLMILDAKYMEWRTIKLKKDPACPVCSSKTL